MEDYAYPPWATAGDEQDVPTHDGFTECETLIQMLASKIAGNIVDRKYSSSKEWGKILRAKLLTGGHGLSVASRVTCWTGSGPGVQIMVDVEGCGPQQAGC
jgi:hypothetical protein